MGIGVLQALEHQLRHSREVLVDDMGGEDELHRSKVHVRFSLASTESTLRRRTTNASACAVARSSHCSSSTRHTGACCSAASDSRLNPARPSRKRSGAGPRLSPNAVRSASACGTGRRSRRSRDRRQQRMQDGERKLHLRLHARAADDCVGRGLLSDVVHQRRLSHRRVPADDQSPALARTDGIDKRHQNVALATPTPLHRRARYTPTRGTPRLAPRTVPWRMRAERTGTRLHPTRSQQSQNNLVGLGGIA